MAIAKWRKLAVTTVWADNQVLEQAQRIMQTGIRQYDALHVACAIAGKADLFVSTDDRLLKRLKTFPNITAVLPGEAIAKLESWYDD